MEPAGADAGAVAAASRPERAVGPDETSGARLRLRLWLWLWLVTLAGLVMSGAGMCWLLDTFVMEAPGIDGRRGPFVAAMGLMFGGLLGLVSGALGLVRLTQAELAAGLADRDPRRRGSEP